MYAIRSYYVHHLTAETLGNDAGADAFTRSVDRCRSACRTATDHQQVVGLFVAEFGCLSLGGSIVDLAPQVAHVGLHDVA